MAPAHVHGALCGQSGRMAAIDAEAVAGIRLLIPEERQLDQSATDNPDQRIADDLDRFTSISLALSIGLMNAVVTLISFLPF